MQHSEHVLMLGEGAEAFAKLHNIEFADDDYFSLNSGLNNGKELKKKYDSFGSCG